MYKVITEWKSGNIESAYGYVLQLMNGLEYAQDDWVGGYAVCLCVVFMPMVVIVVWS